MPLGRRHFKMHFLEWISLYFDLNFSEVCSLWSRWWLANIGSDNSLVLYNWQGIIWTKHTGDELLSEPMILLFTDTYASPCLNGSTLELLKFFTRFHLVSENMFRIVNRYRYFDYKFDFMVSIVSVGGPFTNYIVTPSLIGWAHTQNDPCCSVL